MSYHALPLVSALLLTGQVVAQDIPAELVPPTGTTLIGTFAAKGVQIYTCAAHGAANEWAFKAPEAQLVNAQGKVFLKHYAGPTWEAVDGSKILGKVMKTAPAPTGGDIPWLLLSAESSGSGVLAVARFVQRVNTAGGVAPYGACSKVGADQRVPYTADYLIYN
jgi:hypothetical protein